jgi:hypothetical protein
MTDLNLWPTHVESLAAVDAAGDALEQTAINALAESGGWPPGKSGPGWQIRTGYLRSVPMRVYRGDIDLPASPAAVATLLADQMVERLGEWNKEFRDGQVVRVLRNGPTDRAWLVQVRYATPMPLADREYLYWLRRHDRPDGIVITYQSVDEPVPVPKGAVRAILAGTVHRCVATPTGTRLEHLLIGDLGGLLPRWVQNEVLRGGVFTAQIRDALALRKLFP